MLGSPKQTKQAFKVSTHLHLQPACRTEPWMMNPLHHSPPYTGIYTVRQIAEMVTQLIIKQSPKCWKSYF